MPYCVVISRTRLGPDLAVQKPQAVDCSRDLGYNFPNKDWPRLVNNIHLMYGPEGNSWFCFPESPHVSRDEVEGNIRTRGKTKLTSFPRDQTLSACYIFRLFLQQSQQNIQSGQQLRNCILVGIHLNLIRATWHRINQSQCSFCWAKV